MKVMKVGYSSGHNAEFTHSANSACWPPVFSEKVILILPCKVEATPELSLPWMNGRAVPDFCHNLHTSIA